MAIVLKGIRDLKIGQYEQRALETKDQETKQKVNASISRLIQTLQDCLQLPDVNEPFIYLKKQTSKGFWNETNLCNPYSKSSSLILYLYSMEFSKPALPEMLNRSMR